MRVKDTPPVVLLTMTKKKHKQRRANVANDSEDEDHSEGLKHCSHINKSVNISAVKKSLKTSVFGICSGCSSSGAGADAVSDQYGIYMCLQCANQGCDRSSANKHALCHYQVQHSVPHDIAVDVSTFAVWCYACDEFVTSDVSKKLQECIELIRRHSNSLRSRQLLPLKGGSSRSSVEVASEPSVEQPVASRTTTVVCSKVKGLANLGNTCFFNAVLQILRQTHLLEAELRECTKKGQTVELVAYDSKCAGDMNCASECKLERLQLRLGESSPLSRVLLNVFDEMTYHSASKQQSYVNPSSLFTQVCNKASRFKGFQQQDSHELLRYLLDALKAEEIKRSQHAILKSFNLTTSENTRIKDLSDEQKTKIKDFGRAVKQTFVDRVFGGIFISTIVCHTCNIPSHIFEPFLDISVPIVDEKVDMSSSKQHRDGDRNSTVHFAETVLSASDDHVSGADNRPTKNQLKRQQKQARKQQNKSQRKKTNWVSLDAATHHSTEIPSTGSIDEKDEKDVGAENDDNVEKVTDSEEQSERETIDTPANHGSDGAEKDVSDAESDAGSGGCIDGEINSGTDNGHQDIRNMAATLTDCGEMPEKDPDNIGTESEKCFEPKTNGGAQDNETNTDIAVKENDENITDILTCKEEDVNSSVNIFDQSNDFTETAVNSSITPDTVTANGGMHTDAEVTDHEECSERDVSCVFTDGGSCDEAEDGETSANCCYGSHCDSPHPEANGTIAQLIQNCSANAKKHQHANTSSSDILPEPEIDGAADEFQSPSVQPSSVMDVTNHFENLSLSNGKTDADGKFRLTELRKKAVQAAMQVAADRQRGSSSDGCSVASCLAQFTSTETLSGSNMLACASCNASKSSEKSGNSSNAGQKMTPVLSCASKQLLIYAPPAVLTLHLKRFQQVGFNLKKLTNHVAFTELLDLAPYCSSLSQGITRNGRDHVKVLYSLYGIVEHSGTLRSGHYTAYVKIRTCNTEVSRNYLQTLLSDNVNVDHLVSSLRSFGIEDCEMAKQHSHESEIPVPEGRWYHISDTSVSEVKSLDNVLRCQAYILFYERIF